MIVASEPKKTTERFPGRGGWEIANSRYLHVNWPNLSSPNLSAYVGDRGFPEVAFGEMHRIGAFQSVAAKSECKQLDHYN